MMESGKFPGSPVVGPLPNLGPSSARAPPSSPPPASSPGRGRATALAYLRWPGLRAATNFEGHKGVGLSKMEKKKKKGTVSSQCSFPKH